MKVKDLIKSLSVLDQNALLVCQSDAEGNGYSPLYCIDPVMYVPESTYSGYVLCEEDMSEEDGDVYKENAVVLDRDWETNKAF